MRSAPARTTLVTSSPRRAKSADRMLGAMRQAFCMVLSSPEVVDAESWAAAQSSFRSLARGPGIRSPLLIPLARRPLRGVTAHRVAHVAPLRFLPIQSEARLFARAVHDERQPHRLPAPGRIERIDL